MKLTKDEWRMGLKVVAIVLFAMILLQAAISQQFPAEQFIYGRF